MSPKHKPLVWLHGEISTPPFSADARIQAGYLLRLLQAGVNISMPDARPMPSIGKRCCELRIDDRGKSWRIVCRNDPDAVVICEVFEKKTQRTPLRILEICRDRLKRYDEV